MPTLEYVNAKTPTPESAWVDLSDDERAALVTKVLGARYADALELLKLVETKADGQVIFQLPGELSADKRGGLLLDVEDVLKDGIDAGLTVWLSPLGDKNKLRKLRGIEVKS